MCDVTFDDVYIYTHHVEHFPFSAYLKTIYTYKKKLLQNNIPVYIIHCDLVWTNKSIDVRKAFDVVRQDSLCRKLYNQVDSHSWRFLKENLHTLAHVRSNGMLGDPFEVTQGVGQGKRKNSLHSLLQGLC